jgi:hypothetical protein
MRIFRRRSLRRQRVNVFTGRGWLVVLAVGLAAALAFVAWRGVACGQRRSAVAVMARDECGNLGRRPAAETAAGLNRGRFLPEAAGLRPLPSDGKHRSNERYVKHS